MQTRHTDVQTMHIVRKIHDANVRPAGVPKSAKYMRLIWGVSLEGNALAYSEGRYRVNKNPVPIYKKVIRHPVH